MQTQFRDLTDAQWQVIEKILNQTRKRKYALRAIVNSILWVLRTGSQWRNLPSVYPPWQSVYYYFLTWQAAGLLEKLNSQLNQSERIKEGKAATPSLLCIDFQLVKVCAFVGRDTGRDGNKYINGRKRHLIVDTLGLVWGVVVHAADVHDSQQAPRLVEHCLGYLHRMKKILIMSLCG